MRGVGMTALAATEHPRALRLHEMVERAEHDMGCIAMIAYGNDDHWLYIAAATMREACNGALVGDKAATGFLVIEGDNLAAVREMAGV